MGKQKASKGTASLHTPAPKNDAPSVSISDAPQDNQNVQHNDTVFTTVQEGKAYILIPPDAPRLLDPKTHANEPAQSVFYNPIQQYNRDLTVLAIRAFGEDYLSRQGLKKKKVRRKPAKKTNGAATAGEEVRQDHTIAPAGPSAPNKRKADDDVVQENGTDGKRQKVTSEGADFEDGGIDDEDLLAVESSMQDATPLPTARQPETNGKSSDEQTPAARPPAQEQDPRPPFRILDALSATGLRALRYAHELPFNTHITANDLSKAAVEAIKLNIKHNRLETKIKTSVGNANAHMYSFVAQEGIGGPGQKYHVIDLDPYGTAVPFLDAAVQATTDGGMLCVTCTDTGVFNSMGYAEKAFALYGGLPGKGEHCHEIGLRLILHAISSAAAKYGIAIEPLLSLSIDYYARVFVRVRKSPADVKFLASKTMLVYACDHGCGAWSPQFLMRATENTSKKGEAWYKHTVAQGPAADISCQCCGSKMHVAGPMWGGALHNPSFVQKVLDVAEEADKGVYKTISRVEGMLGLALEEMMVQDMGKLLVPASRDKDVRVARQQAEEALRAAKEAEKAIEDADEEAPAINGHRRNSSSPIPEPQSEPEIITDQPSDASTSPNDPTRHMYQPLSPSFRDLSPFYINASNLSRILHCQAPPDAALRGALKSMGYQCVRSHAQAGSMKTNAPWEAIWDIMVAWTQQEGKEIREGALSEMSAGFGVLKRWREREAKRMEESKETEDGNEKNEDSDTKRKIVFDEKLGREEVKKRGVRYQINPRANWGPMAKAK